MFQQIETGWSSPRFGWVFAAGGAIALLAGYLLTKLSLIALGPILLSLGFVRIRDGGLTSEPTQPWRYWLSRSLLIGSLGCFGWPTRSWLLVPIGSVFLGLSLVARYAPLRRR